MFAEVAVGVEAVVILVGAIVVVVVVEFRVAAVGLFSFLAVLLVAELSGHPVTLGLRLRLDDSSLLDATPHRGDVAAVQAVAVALRDLRTVEMSVSLV